MKKMTALMAMLLCSLALFAQSHSYTPGQVAFSPVFDASFAGFPAEVCSVMETKLTQIVMNNGCGSFSDRYAITARLVVEDKEVTATVPARYKVDMHVQLIAVDLEKTGEWVVSADGVDTTVFSEYDYSRLQKNIPTISAEIGRVCGKPMTFRVSIKAKNDNIVKKEVPPQVKILVDMFKGTIVNS